MLEITQRSPSPIPQTHSDKIKTTNKKLSLDISLQPHGSDKPKRASSDTSDKFSKRSSSSASDKSATQKRCIEEARYSSRTPSERSFILHTPETPKGPVATPELLAELLKGSSEKLVAEQHHMHGGGNTHHHTPVPVDFGCDLPSAVLKCLVSRLHSLYVIFFY